MVQRSAILIVFVLSSFCIYAQNTQGQGVFADQMDQNNKIQLYPNPAPDYLIVEIENQDLGKIEFELRSMIGNKIIVRAEDIGQNRYRISLKNFSSGYYFLVIKDDYSRFKKAYKFLKK
jgi:hypothetical protein